MNSQSALQGPLGDLSSDESDDADSRFSDSSPGLSDTPPSLTPPGSADHRDDSQDSNGPDSDSNSSASVAPTAVLAAAVGNPGPTAAADSDAAAIDSNSNSSFNSGSEPGLGPDEDSGGGSTSSHEGSGRQVRGVRGVLSTAVHGAAVIQSYFRNPADWHADDLKSAYVFLCQTLAGEYRDCAIDCARPSLTIVSACHNCA